MALIKDGNGVAIVRFENGLIKTVNSSGEIVNTSNYAYTYNQHSGAGMAMGVSPSKNDTVLVKADVSAAGNGYIFGNTNVNIRKNGTNMIWNIGGTDVATHAIESGFHVYGIVMDGTNEKMRAFYDGSFLDTVGHAPTTPGSNYYIGSNSTSGGASGVRIAEVMALVSPTSGTNKAYFHFYPTNGGNYYETRYYAAQISATSTSSGTPAPYGITLDDVKYATGSKYKDLMAIMTEDGGADRLCGWDSTSAQPAYTPQAPYASHTFAFDLHGVNIVGTTEPSGGEPGLLKRGRKPRWLIWNNSVKHGFYIYVPSGSSTGKQLRYNLFKEYNYVQGQTPYQSAIPRLEWFEGYRNLNGSYTPAIKDSETEGSWEVEYNNGQACHCGDNYIIGGNTTYGKTRWVFLYSNPIHGSTSVRIGNAAPWNLTAAELTNIGDMIFNGFSADVLLKDMSDYTVFHALVDDSASQDYDGRFFCSTYPNKDAYQKNLTAVVPTFDENYAKVLFEFLRDDATQIVQNQEYTSTVNATCELKLLLKSVASETIAQRSVSLFQLLRKHNTQIKGTLNYGMRLMVDFSNVSSLNVGIFVQNALDATHFQYYSPSINGIGGYFRLGVCRWEQYQGSWVPFNHDTPFGNVTLYAKTTITSCRATSESSYPAPKALASEYTLMKRLLQYGEIPDDARQMRPTTDWNYYIFNTGTENKGAYGDLSDPPRSVTTYSRYAIFTNEDVFGSAGATRDLSDNTSIHITLYNQSNAPIVTSTGGIMNPTTYVPQQELSISPAIYALYATESSERTLAEAQGDSVVVKHKLRLYNLVSVSGQTEADWQVITTGAFQYNVVMHKNESSAAIEFPIPSIGVEVISGGGAYKCKVTAGKTIEGRWHNPGCYHYIEINPGSFYEIEIKQLLGTINAGDYYTISLATYNP